MHFDLKKIVCTPLIRLYKLTSDAMLETCGPRSRSLATLAAAKRFTQVHRLGYAEIVVFAVQGSTRIIKHIVIHLACSSS